MKFCCDAGSRGKMDKCTFCAGGSEADGTPIEYEQ